MTTKTARLDLRLSPEQHELLERAASLVGSSVASYCIATLMDDAARSVAMAHRIGLLDDDWAAFVDALDSPPGVADDMDAELGVVDIPEDEAWRELRLAIPPWAE